MKVLKVIMFIAVIYCLTYAANEHKIEDIGEYGVVTSTVVGGGDVAFIWFSNDPSGASTAVPEMTMINGKNRRFARIKCKEDLAVILSARARGDKLAIVVDKGSIGYHCAHVTMDWYWTATSVLAY